MQIKTDGLVLRSAEYGESDRMVTLLTADEGKIGVNFKGVKKAGAKLAFAVQPFCFAEYVLAERGGRYTATSASLYDGFYELREDLVAFYAASVVLEACDRLVFSGMDGRESLLFAVKALTQIEEKGVQALLAFFVRALEGAGYPLHLGDCPKCGKPLHGKLYFDFESGAFFCEDCKVGERASVSTYLTLRAAGGLKGEIFSDGVKRALRLVKSYFAYQTDSDLPALGELIRLL